MFTLILDDEIWDLRLTKKKHRSKSNWSNRTCLINSSLFSLISILIGVVGYRSKTSLSNGIRRRSSLFEFVRLIEIITSVIFELFVWFSKSNHRLSYSDYNKVEYRCWYVAFANKTKTKMQKKIYWQWFCFTS